MVFWKRFIKTIKLNIPSELFNKWVKKVEKNIQDIEQNKTNIQTNTNDLTTIKSKYAKKDETNSFTQFQNFDGGGNFRGDLNVYNDRKFKLGYTPNDVKIEIGGVSGNSNAKIRATKANLELTAEGSVVINKIPTPTSNDSVANKKYVDDKVATTQNDLDTQKVIITNMEDRLDEIPDTYLSKQDATNTYVSKVDANATYGRMDSGISNDWNSSNIFRQTPQVMSSITNNKDVATKEYVDGKLGGLQQIKKISTTITNNYDAAYKDYWTPIYRIGNKIPVCLDILVRKKGDSEFTRCYMNRVYFYNSNPGDRQTSSLDYQFTLQTMTYYGTTSDDIMIWYKTNLTKSATIEFIINLYYIDAF